MKRIRTIFQTGIQDRFLWGLTLGCVLAFAAGGLLATIRDSDRWDWLPPALAEGVASGLCLVLVAGQLRSRELTAEERREQQRVEEQSRMRGQLEEDVKAALLAAAQKSPEAPELKRLGPPADFWELIGDEGLPLEPDPNPAWSKYFTDLATWFDLRLPPLHDAIGAAEGKAEMLSHSELSNLLSQVRGRLEGWAEEWRAIGAHPTTGGGRLKPTREFLSSVRKGLKQASQDIADTAGLEAALTCELPSVQQETTEPI